MIETITSDNLTIAIIIRSAYKPNGIEFFTPPEFSQQLGYINRPKGYFIPPHSHRLNDSKGFLTQEVLHVRSGQIKMELFNTKNEFVKETIISTGDTILLAQGGHSLEMLEECDLIEIKQGPYFSDDDKVNFIPVK